MEEYDCSPGANAATDEAMYLRFPFDKKGLHTGKNDRVRPTPDTKTRGVQMFHETSMGIHVGARQDLDYKL